MTIRRLAGAWDRFWFEPEDCSTLALTRIAFGLLMTAWTLWLVTDLFAFFSGDGVVGTRDAPPGEWSLLAISSSRAAVVGLYLMLLAGCLALTLGYRTRLAALAVFVGVISFEHRNPFVHNSGDGLLRILALYMVLAPAGMALSLDRLRRAPGAFWEFPKSAPWVRRLIQLQVSLIYLATAWFKLRGETWGDGTAVSYSMRLGLERFPPPTAVLDSAVLMAWASHATLVAELAMPILIWNRRTRPYALLAGIALHLGIDFSLRVGFFSWAMLTAYLAFLPPEAVSARVRALRDRVRPLRPRPSRAQPEPLVSTTAR